MSNHGPDVLAELRLPARELRQRIPEAYEAFSKLHSAALAPGALDGKTKELIALAVAVSSQCDGCIASHARGAHRQGATEQEVAEAIGVTFLMSGGPATVYGPRAMAAFQAFANPEG
ncbi:MAG: carboxymuconolactone decarboxylase family protein [Nocardioidaceae bacterium]|jgi:AhpD family alkylhydroperoxidase|nr:carboxymuconolactone decarboxylase family protein [Nocardioidaceae bacterium]